MTKSETEGQQRVFEQSDSCQAADFRTLAHVENFTLTSSEALGRKFRTDYFKGRVAACCQSGE